MLYLRVPCRALWEGRNGGRGRRENEGARKVSTAGAVGAAARADPVDAHLEAHIQIDLAVAQRERGAASDRDEQHVEVVGALGVGEAAAAAHLRAGGAEHRGSAGAHAGAKAGEKRAHGGVEM